MSRVVLADAPKICWYCHKPRMKRFVWPDKQVGTICSNCSATTVPLAGKYRGVYSKPAAERLALLTKPKSRTRR